MAKPLLSITLDTSGLEKVFRDLPGVAVDVTRRTVLNTGKKAFRRIRNRTPVDRGKARGSWRIRPLKGGLVIEIRGGGKRAPHLGVLELGGYPVRARSRVRNIPAGAFIRGKAVLGGRPPGPRTQRPPRVKGLEPPAKPRGRALNPNVSKQAPRGMLRITFGEIEPEFVADLEEALDEAFDRLAR